MTHINEILNKIKQEIDNVVKSYSYDIQEEGEEGKTAGYVNGFCDGANKIKEIFIKELEINGVESDLE